MGGRRSSQRERPDRVPSASGRGPAQGDAGQDARLSSHATVQSPGPQSARTESGDPSVRQAGAAVVVNEASQEAAKAAQLRYVLPRARGNGRAQQAQDPSDERERLSTSDRRSCLDVCRRRTSGLAPIMSCKEGETRATAYCCACASMASVN